VQAWHDEATSLVLVVVGILLLVGGALLHRTESVEITFLVLGVGLLTVGGLLSRIEGTIKIGPKGAEVPVIARNATTESLLRMEEVREKAEETLPTDQPEPRKDEKIAEAIGRAYLDLFPNPAVLSASVAASDLSMFPTKYWAPNPTYGSERALGGPPPETVFAADYTHLMSRLAEPPDQFANRILLNTHWLNAVEDPDEEEQTGEESPPAPQ
jgi:hypothetical protein